MRWLLIIGGALVIIVAIIATVGALLPRDHIARVTTRIAGTPEAVWQTIADVGSQSAWRKGITRIEMLPPMDGKTAWREHSSNGAILMAIDVAEPPHRLLTRIADAKLPFGGTWEYVVTPAADGASVTITERGSVYNPAFRFLSRFVFGHTATMDAYLRSLARKFGSEVTPSVITIDPQSDLS